MEITYHTYSQLLYDFACLVRSFLRGLPYFRTPLLEGWKADGVNGQPRLFCLPFARFSRNNLSED